MFTAKAEMQVTIMMELTEEQAIFFKELSMYNGEKVLEILKENVGEHYLEKSGPAFIDFLAQCRAQLPGITERIDGARAIVNGRKIAVTEGAMPLK